MNLDDFNYELPKTLIAQTPLKKRDQSRLLVLDRKTNHIKHDVFYNVINYLNKGDILVLNNSKVIPVRLLGRKEKTKAKIELLLLKEENNIWEALVKPSRRVKINTVISFGDGQLKAKCIQVLKDGISKFTLMYDGVLYSLLDELGQMPLPPYITQTLKDKDSYQTIYAKNKGSAAAPTAGFHFTKSLLKKIENKGIKIVPITLHVGLGTFRPVKVNNIKDHTMHSEFYMMSKESADILNKAKATKGKIIAVGTTTVRTLEAIIKKHGKFTECSGWTNIFIYPGYQFKAIDMLLTNFHLPKSTLIMLVSALATKEKVMCAYSEAIKEKYRFFSFGDSMLIK